MNFVNSKLAYSSSKFVLSVRLRDQSPWNNTVSVPCLPMPVPLGHNSMGSHVNLISGIVTCTVL